MPIKKTNETDFRLWAMGEAVATAAILEEWSPVDGGAPGVS